MKILITLLFVSLSFNLCAQTAQQVAGDGTISSDSTRQLVDTICVRNSGEGVVYTSDGVLLDYQKLSAMMKNNPDAAQHLMSARQGQNLRNAFLCGAAILIIGDLYLISKDQFSTPKFDSMNYQKSDPSITPLIAGVVMTLLAIPITSHSKSELREAVTRYNKGRRSSSAAGIPLHLSLGLSGGSLSYYF